MSDFATWYYSVPTFTRLWFSGTIVVSLLGKLNILPVEHLFLSSTLLFQKFQVYFLTQFWLRIYNYSFHSQLWRPMTSLLFYPPSFHFLINLYLLYSYSSKLERDQYKTTPSDYFFLLFFCWICTVISGLIFNIYFLMDAMVMCVIYIFCQMNKDVIVTFWFGTRFKAVYLPWVLLVVNFILSNGAMDSLSGIVVGHLYYFLKYQYPQEHGGSELLHTPAFL